MGGETLNKENLVKQINGNRKMTIDHHAIKTFENFAEILDLKVDPSIYEKKIPKTKYIKMKNESRYFPKVVKKHRYYLSVTSSGKGVYR